MFPVLIFRSAILNRLDRIEFDHFDLKFEIYAQNNLGIPILKKFTPEFTELPIFVYFPDFAHCAAARFGGVRRSAEIPKLLCADDQCT